MDKKVVRSVMELVGIIAGIVGMALCFVWFDWKLFLVVFLMMWGNNVGKGGNRG